MWDVLTSSEAWGAAVPVLLLIAVLLVIAWRSFPHLRRLFRLIERQAAVPEQVERLRTEVDAVKSDTSELCTNGGTSVRDRIVDIDNRTIHFGHRLGTVERRIDVVERRIDPS